MDSPENLSFLITILSIVIFIVVGIIVLAVVYFKKSYKNHLNNEFLDEKSFERAMIRQFVEKRTPNASLNSKIQVNSKLLNQNEIIKYLNNANLLESVESDFRLEGADARAKVVLLKNRKKILIIPDIPDSLNHSHDNIGRFDLVIFKSKGKYHVLQSFGDFIAERIELPR